MARRRRPDGLEIVPISFDRLDDLDRLFASGEPRRCQCAFVRMTNADWSAASPAARRDVHHRAIQAAARDGYAAGLMAYRDGEPVGWVSFDRREAFERLTSALLRPVDDKPVWSIVCFVVAAGSRRDGVASALLDATIAYARERNVRLLESYPVDVTPGAPRRPSADVWRGTVSMFEHAGFATVDVRRQHASAPPRPIMRRSVSARRTRSTGEGQ